MAWNDIIAAVAAGIANPDDPFAYWRLKAMRDRMLGEAEARQLHTDLLRLQIEKEKGGALPLSELLTPSEFETKTFPASTPPPYEMPTGETYTKEIPTQYKIDWSNPKLTTRNIGDVARIAGLLGKEKEEEYTLSPGQVRFKGRKKIAELPKEATDLVFPTEEQAIASIKNVPEGYFVVAKPTKGGWRPDYLQSRREDVPASVKEFREWSKTPEGQGKNYADFIKWKAAVSPSELTGYQKLLTEERKIKQEEKAQEKAQIILYGDPKNVLSRGLIRADHMAVPLTADEINKARNLYNSKSKLWPKDAKKIVDEILTDAGVLEGKPPLQTPQPEVIEYEANGKRYRIPRAKVKEFLKDKPNAKRIK